MKSIEFTTSLHCGQIAVPPQFELSEGQTVRVKIFLQEIAPEATQADVLKSTAGSWSGELVQEPQGNYPIRADFDE
jgi:hypothetical protein